MTTWWNEDWEWEEEGWETAEAEGGGIFDYANATVIEVRPKETKLPEVGPPDGENVEHIVRFQHRHALCGVEVDKDSYSLTKATGLKDCEHCSRILRLWLEGMGWEGFGPRPSDKHRAYYQKVLDEGR